MTRLIKVTLVEEPSAVSVTAARGAGWAIAGGATAMVTVGGSAAVSGLLVTAPLGTAQALRYAAASVLLAVYAGRSGHPVRRPRGREWWWLGAVAATGLVGFNIALVLGARHAEPAVFGVAVAGVPLLLAILGPLADRRSPSGRLGLAAACVTAGAVLVQGLGRSDGIGLAWAVVVFLCEAGFTLLALPLLPRHGAVGVSVHTTWMAAVLFAVVGLSVDGPSALTRLTVRDVVVIGYLALAVTALAFVLWYSAVGRLGADRAGLLTGIAPVAAATTGVLLGGPAPSPAVWVGVAVVAVGVATGLTPRRDRCASPRRTLRRQK